MPRSNRSMMKLGLVGLALFALAGFAASQAIQALSASDRILILQAKRFEGSYKLANGETKLKVEDNAADWSVASGGVNLSASLAPQAGKPNRATLNVDGRTIEGKAGIEGRTMTFEFVDGKTTYRITFSLSGRNEGDLSVKKDDATLASGSFRRV